MPKIDLNNAPLLDKEEMEQFKNADDLLAEVGSQAARLGLLPYPKPTNVPENLADMDISELPNNQLGNLYSQYTAHAQYVNGELVKAEIAYRSANTSLKQLDAKLKLKLFARDVPKAEVPAMVREDPIRIDYEMEVLKLFAMKEILEAHYKVYSKQAEALSRIIALRELEFNQSMRDHTIQNRRKDQVRRQPLGSGGQFERAAPSKGSKDDG